MSSARPPQYPTLHPAQLRPLRARVRASIRDAGLTDFGLTPGLNGLPFWELEPTPLVIDSQEWNTLESALRQRAHFVNALLVDLYGGQQALHQQILPPELILSDPYYRRPCLGLEPDRASPATLLRFDLVKTAEGWLFDDTRANTPIGLSYAVQNRRFMTQEATDLYRALPDYHSVINFPLLLLDHLRNLARDADHAPSIVVLTAGPHDPFYSEHSFLARKMGLPLARGDDLLVLDNRVYFKTIAGLERVDVIYRRLNDSHIDPVVFSTDRENAGIPGLLQCIRTGNVVLANAIGTGVAESRSLNAYVPRLMRFYLGEKPILGTVPTYTCGDTDHLDYILEHGDQLRILPAHDPRTGDWISSSPAPASPDLFGPGGLSPIVRQNPHAFVAQPRLKVLPVSPGPRNATPARLSAFVLCQGKRFSVFPGGLVRLGEPDRTRIGLTADTVVLIDTQDNSGDIADYETPSGGVQANTLGSRSAEHLFWLGRYLERAEATARMLSILDDVALEEISAKDRRRWLPLWRGLLEATGHTDHKITARANPQASLSTDLMWRMSLDTANSSSIYSSVSWAVENARQLRDYVSPEVWTTLGRLLRRLDDLHKLRPVATRRTPVRIDRGPPLPTQAVDAVITEINAIIGLAERTMVQDAGWHFLHMGMHLERATMTCSALRHILSALDLAATPKVPASPDAKIPYRDNPELSALLRMLGSQDAYRRLYQTRSQPRFVAELFIQQPDAPRSIFHNLHQIKTSLRAIRHDVREQGDDPTIEAVADTLRFIASVPLAQHFNDDHVLDHTEAARLGDTLAELLDRLYDLHPVLSDHYFSHQARIAPSVTQVELKL